MLNKLNKVQILSYKKEEKFIQLW